MDKTIGQAFKLLRVSKDMSAKEMVSPKISYAQLIKFEKGETALTVDKFFDILTSINVSAKEFQRAHHQLTQSENLKFNGYIVMAYVQKNTAKLEALLKRTIEWQKLEPDKKRHHLNEIEIRAFLFDLDKRRSVPRSQVHYLENYLLRVKEWSEYEIWLLANSVGLFTPETLTALTDKMIHPEKNLIWLAKNQRKMNIAVLNVVKQLILVHQFEQAADYLKYLRAHIVYDLDMHEKAVLVGTEQLFNLAKDAKDEQAHALFLEILHSLELFESFDTINFLKNFAKDLRLDF